MATTTSTVYVNVIEDVINKVRDEFSNNGPGEDVLKELQGMWEAKMMQAGVVNAPIKRSAGQKPTPGGPITPVHDLNVPYEGTEEFETPTAEMLFPPTPLQTPIQTPLPGPGDNLYNIPTGPNDYPASGNDIGGGGAVGVGNSEMKNGRPSPYMQPPSPWMTQRPSLDVSIAYVEGRDEVNRGASHQPPTQDFFMASSGKRKRDEFASQYQTGGFIPQQDGAGDATSEVFVIELSEGSTSLGRDTKNALLARIVRTSSKIPQVDGPIPDPYDDVLSTPNIYNYQGVFNEDYNVANTPAPNDVPASTPAIPVPNDIGDDDDDEPPLNENDDDDELDDVDPGEELNTQHLVLAQFEKVTRTKSRWKCILKDGIMHISDKDVLFNKATGEFDF